MFKNNNNMHEYWSLQPSEKKLDEKPAIRSDSFCKIALSTIDTKIVEIDTKVKVLIHHGTNRH